MTILKKGHLIFKMKHFSFCTTLKTEPFKNTQPHDTMPILIQLRGYTVFKHAKNWPSFLNLFSLFMLCFLKPKKTEVKNLHYWSNFTPFEKALSLIRITISNFKVISFFFQNHESRI